MNIRLHAYGLRQLAWIAALLLALAPSLSRWEQSRGETRNAMAMPNCGGHRLEGRTPGHDQDRLAHDHAGGEACEYCGLAALLLPGATLWLSVPQLGVRVPLQVRCAGQTRSETRWSALGARGPPEHRVSNA